MSREVSRRSILSGAGAMAAAAAITAPSLATSATAGEDARLVKLWRRLLEAHAAYEHLRDLETAAVLRMPEWARWGGRAANGVAISDPEWTDAMLSEHGIPATMGRRPTWKQIEDLNQSLYSAALGRAMPDVSITEIPLTEWKEHYRTAQEQPEVKAVAEANARRKAAYDARREEQRAEEQRAGLNEIDDAQERAGDVLFPIVDQIVEAEARTLLGMVLKLRAWSLSVLDWGGADQEDLDGDEQCVLSVLKGLESLLPADARKTIPPITLRRWDRPDARPAKEVANAA